MPLLLLRRILSVATAIVAVLSLRVAVAAEETVDYARDVRPILSRYCFKCHGPDDDKRQGGLRLDLRENALAEAESGERAIVPQHPEQSELLKRIASADEGTLMPPPETKQSLTPQQQEILRRWIAEGAEYKPHWAFLAPQQHPLPAVKQADWPRNAIDAFILARLEQEQLAPAAEADRYTLVRRLYLDLIGLPPTPEEAEAFVHNRRVDAYERLVDQLLASPAYGERWARRWLDLARYADTNGYEKDRVRSIWPYRDWVIGALNQDLPFDQFTIEQLAGDMLPNATLKQKIATGFHRNTMINEEGGIDPLEFRYYAVVDRTNTTATTWLGLTLGCAQCHTHKYDPIPHREYFSMLAYLNNADEPELPVSTPELETRRASLMQQIAELEATLPERFAADAKYEFTRLKPTKAVSAGGATLAVSDDGTLLVGGTNPDADTYTLELNGPAKAWSAIQLEALTDDTLPGTGPGRTPHGNFVLSEIKLALISAKDSSKPVPIQIASASADFEQMNFGVAGALDGDPKTGWAIHGTGKWNTNRTATFVLAKPIELKPGDVLRVELAQDYGKQHTLGKFRIRAGSEASGMKPVAERGRELFEARYSAWKAEARKQAVKWTVLQPAAATSEVPRLTILEDQSIISSGDQTKRDVYSLRFADKLPAFTAIRLEAMADENLPKGGPGRIYYEGPPGDFFLSQISGTANGEPLKFAKAAQSFASGGSTAEKAIDTDPQSGWSINGGQGQSHTAIFVLDRPATGVTQLEIQLLFERYYAAGLGRFRISVSDDPRAVEQIGLPPEIHEALLATATQASPQHESRLRKYFASIAPELAAERAKIDQLRKQLPQLPTTLVLSERPKQYPRTTHRMHRGEFLQPKEEVGPGTLSAIGPPLPFQEHNRLTFAKWLVHRDHVLTARVTVNRQWAAFFGRGIVRTTEDFGLQGELPSHPQLLDWLAVEFMEQGWSLKDLHRLIVTSSTYRQASRVSPELAQRDPQNILLARGPRVRLEAEQIRDAALAASGLLSRKQGGPSVFPPQPPGITTEGAYGALAWNVSSGEDRYRRGLYTFAKRSAPFAMANTFDAPSGEACVPRRDVSNTPLQALLLLNDQVFVETAQELGRQTAASEGEDVVKLRTLFQRIVVRPPNEAETLKLLKFAEAQRARLATNELDASAIAGAGEHARERALWTIVARALLNLDETIVKE